MTLPKTFKHCTFKEKGGPLVLEQVELKDPGKGQVLIKVEACGVCRGDSLPQKDALGVGYPLTPGHEVIGRIVAVGEGVNDWKVGDRAGGGWYGGSDGTCNACKKGLPQMCDKSQVNGVTRNGGYAEYCYLSQEATIPIPEHIDAAKYAPVLCAGLTVFNSMRQQNIAPGSLVAVQGIGGLGHLAIQYSVKSGYKTVAISRGSTKEKFARDFGAHDYIDESKGDAAEQLQKLGGADLIICTAPNPEAIGPLVKGLALLGKLLIIAGTGEMTFDTVAMVTKGLTITAWLTGNVKDAEETIAFTEMGGVNCMIEKFPLDKANEAYGMLVKLALPDPDQANANVLLRAHAEW